MNSIDIDLYGNPMFPDQLPVLSLIWHRCKYGVYLYSASFCFVGRTNTPIVKIEIDLCENVYEAKDLITNHRKVSVYFPIIVDEDKSTIRLNDTKIVEALALNNWTFTRDKQRNLLKEYPASFAWIHGDQEQRIVFPVEFYKTPALLSEPFLAKLNVGEKIEMRLHF